MTSRACGWIAFGALTLHATSAAAEEPKGPVSLEWIAPRECPAAADVSARTAARLSTGARVNARGRITKAAGRYKLVLEIDSRGERVLEASTCDALASSASVVLAMSVAPPVPAEEASPPVEPPIGNETTSLPPSKPEVDRPIAAPSPFKRSASVRAQGAFDVGTLPALGAGGGIALGLDPTRALHFELTGSVWASQSGTLGADTARGASFHMLTAGAQGCWVLSRPVIVAPCAGAEVIALSASGFGSNRTSEASSVGWGPTATVTLGVPLGPHVMLRAGMGIVVPTTRQAFVIASGLAPDAVVANELHRPAAISARGWLGPEVVF